MPNNIQTILINIVSEWLPTLIFIGIIISVAKNFKKKITKNNTSNHHRANSSSQSPKEANPQPILQNQSPPSKRGLIVFVFLLFIGFNLYVFFSAGESNSPHNQQKLWFNLASNWIPILIFILLIQFVGKKYSKNNSPSSQHNTQPKNPYSKDYKIEI